MWGSERNWQLNQRVQWLVRYYKRAEGLVVLKAKVEGGKSMDGAVLAFIDRRIGPNLMPLNADFKCSKFQPTF